MTHVPVPPGPKPTAPTPPFETLDVTVADRVGRITLNQPDNLNPLGLVPLREIAEAAVWVNSTDASVVVVTGAGDRAFSAGFDLRDFGDQSGTPGGGMLGSRMADAVEAIEAVTIAAIHGHCIGGGVVLAAACDLRIAADNTRFAIPEVDLGIPLAWGGIPRLVREIGPAATRELVMTCRPFDALEAKSLGLLNQIVARDQLDLAVDELVATLLDKAPSLLRATKHQVHEAIENVASTRNGWVGQTLIDAANNDPQANAAAVRYLKSR